MSLRLAGVAVIASLGIADARMPRPLPPTVQLAGDYESTYGRVHLTQQGNQIHGEYPCCGGGSLDGRIIENRIVKFHWTEPRGAGEGEGMWQLRGGRLEGSWGHGQSETDGGAWNLWRGTSKQIAK